MTKRRQINNLRLLSSHIQVNLLASLIGQLTSVVVRLYKMNLFNSKRKLNERRQTKIYHSTVSNSHYLFPVSIKLGFKIIKMKEVKTLIKLLIKSKIGLKIKSKKKKLDLVKIRSYRRQQYFILKKKGNLSVKIQCSSNLA